MSQDANQIPNFDIRFATEEDAPYLKAWLDAPGGLDFFPTTGEEETKGAIDCWIGYAKYQACLTATIDGVPCGIGALFFLPYRKVAHQALIKVAVAPEQRRKGIGSSLVKNLKHLAKTRFQLKLVYAEVYGDSPFLPVLEQQGFKQFAYQEKFVKTDRGYLPRRLLEVLL